MRCDSRLWRSRCSAIGRMSEKPREEATLGVPGAVARVMIELMVLILYRPVRQPSDMCNDQQSYWNHIGHSVRWRRHDSNSLRFPGGHVLDLTGYIWIGERKYLVVLCEHLQFT